MPGIQGFLAHGPARHVGYGQMSAEDGRLFEQTYKGDAPFASQAPGGGKMSHFPPLVECVPNFSEGRRPEVVSAIVEAMAAIPQVRVLDVHSDPDHNRSVVTLVGPPEAVAEAAFRGIAEAAQRIDLNLHEGQHPFIGAADVVPFIPLEGMTMEDAVHLARNLARRVADVLHLPVYLYGEAALRPERRDLAHIRRGGYVRLKKTIATDPDRTPDFGPSRLGPAGAVVIGARDVLIAYNVYLNTDDVEVARRIARAVRHSSGGLRYVKALGLRVKGRAQVSMNLTNFRKTPLHRVMETIRREAARYGTSVHHSELVGMIPQQAVWDTARWYLQLDEFHEDPVLETRICKTFHTPTDDVLHRLAQKGPGPALVSLVGYTGALAASLMAQLAGTLGARGREHRRRALALRETLLQWAEADAAALQAHWDVVRKMQGKADPSWPEALHRAPRAIQEGLRRLQALLEDLYPHLHPGPRKDAEGLRLLVATLQRMVQEVMNEES